VVPERDAQARSLLHGLDLPDVLTAPDVASVTGALAGSPSAVEGSPERPSRTAALRAGARRTADRLRAGAPRVRASWRFLRRPG
jgi:hypothetical protein